MSFVRRTERKGSNEGRNKRRADQTARPKDRDQNASVAEAFEAKLKGSPELEALRE